MEGFDEKHSLQVFRLVEINFLKTFREIKAQLL